MNYLKLNRIFHSIVILAILSLAVPSPAFLPYIRADTNIRDIHHEPSVNITSDDQVTIHLTLENGENVTSVQYQYCEIDPGNICSIYKDMTQGDGLNYTAVLPSQKGGYTIGYKVKIEYENDTEEYTPNKDDYHEFTVIKGDEEGDSSFSGAIIVIASVLAASIIISAHHKHTIKKNK